MLRSGSENEELSFISIQRCIFNPVLGFIFRELTEILSNIFLFVRALPGSGSKFCKKISKHGFAKVHLVWSTLESNPADRTVLICFAMLKYPTFPFLMLSKMSKAQLLRR